MPIYEYRRPDGSTFEVIQKFTDDPLSKDPETGDPVERVYSAPAIHFKGSGFHNTDYSSKRRAKAGGDGGGDSGGESGGGEGGSSDAKSESTSSGSGGSDSASSTDSKSASPLKPGDSSGSSPD